MVSSVIEMIWRARRKRGEARATQDELHRLENTADMFAAILRQLVSNHGQCEPNDCPERGRYAADEQARGARAERENERRRDQACEDSAHRDAGLAHRKQEGHAEVAAVTRQHV